MTPDQKAAIDYANSLVARKRNYEDFHPFQLQAFDAFLAGAAWKEAQVLGLLRSDDAAWAEFRHQDHSDCAQDYATGHQWADWLESQLKKEARDGEG